MFRKLCLPFFLISTFTQAETSSIEFTLTGREVINHAYQEIKMASLNPELKKKNLPPFDKKLVFKKDESKKVVQAKIETIVKNLENFNQAFGRKTELYVWNAYFYELPKLCYRGKIEDVKTITEQLMGTLLHPDQGIQGIKYLDKKFITYPEEFFENNIDSRANYIDNGYRRAIGAWENFDSKSEKVLILSDYGPQGDGTELTATQISRCN
ncbi:MAG: hypothetical protein QE271_00315 [Bacteriovoracaceae bacterium]|nr:hypothetical protein [Bacteriovoracaceae bacterium]